LAGAYQPTVADRSRTEAALRPLADNAPQAHRPMHVRVLQAGAAPGRSPGLTPDGLHSAPARSVRRHRPRARGDALRPRYARVPRRPRARAPVGVDRNEAREVQTGLYELRR